MRPVTAGDRMVQEVVIEMDEDDQDDATALTPVKDEYPAHDHSRGRGRGIGGLGFRFGSENSGRDDRRGVDDQGRVDERERPHRGRRALPPEDEAGCGPEEDEAHPEPAMATGPRVRPKTSAIAAWTAAKPVTQAAAPPTP